MEAERWNRVEELFQSALARPAGARAEYLRDACPEDGQLRAEVEKLLENAGDDDSFLADSPLAAALSPGQTIGNFEILNRVGSGGMGEVYRARDVRLNREVAIKVQHRSFANDPGRLARFEREARAASALNDAHIVCVYDLGKHGSITWIASELVNGKSLREVLKNAVTWLRRSRFIPQSDRLTKAGGTSPCFQY